MTTKLLATALAVLLVLAYVGPLVVKMQDLALAAVVLIGLVVMLADLWQSLREDRH